MIESMPDYHLHTTLCNHAYGTMEEYVERAIGIGLREIGFAEHMPVMPESHICISYNDLPFYVKRVRELQERYADRITIRLGAEMDMNLERIDEIERIIETWNFDYVIGSIHYVDGFPFDQDQYRDTFEKVDLNDLYDRFFETVIEAARTGLYDITGHVDNLKRMGYRPSNDMTPNYEEVAALLKEMDLTAELNTSGFDYPAGETYPSLEFLKILNTYGVPVTIGSDSHRPEHVGRHFGRSHDVLVAAGYDSIAHFEARKRLLKPI